MQAKLSKQTNVYLIPEILNLFLLVSSSALALGLLHIASNSQNFYLKICVVILFSLVNNTLFSLLHECVHGIFNRNQLVNLWAGRIVACWFPTSFLVQKNFHLTHHINNRNEHEQFDVIHDGDKVWLKYAQWYSIFTGVYWWVSQLSLLVFLILPNKFLKITDKRISQNSKTQTGGQIYLAALLKSPAVVSRLEILGAYLFHISLCIIFKISLSTWLICYAAFAFQWSSLQYTDHACSPLDNKTGAWNLKISPILGIWFLNYHYHLAHHQHPNVSWYYLPEIIDRSQPTPHFFKVWWVALHGPKRANEFPNI